MTNVEKLEKARAAAVQQRARARRERLATLIAETATSRCHCELSAEMTREELIRLGAGCNHPLWVCPRLDKIRRLFV